jgi:hypothetical protein
MHGRIDSIKESNFFNTIDSDSFVARRFIKSLLFLSQKRLLLLALIFILIKKEQIMSTDFDTYNVETGYCDGSHTNSNESLLV